MDDDDRDPRTGPEDVDLVPGMYYWCRCEQGTGAICGRVSACGTDRPLEFRMLQARHLKLCQCRNTRTPPVCDGTHLRRDGTRSAGPAHPRERSIFRERIRRARESGGQG